MKKTLILGVLIPILAVSLLHSNSTVEAQILVGETPDPCKFMKYWDFIVPLAYSGLPDAVNCSSSPQNFVSDSYQGFGDGQVSYRFPDYSITAKGGMNTKRGYTTQDTSHCGNDSYAPSLVIELARPASYVSAELRNWLDEPVSFTITDNSGRSQKIIMQPCDGIDPDCHFVSLGDGITRITITQDAYGSDPEMRWFFSIRNILFKPDLPLCNCDRVFGPAGRSVSGHDWSMDVEVSEDDGLVLRNVTLAHRYMAQELSLPYYILQTSALEMTRAELKPNSSDETARSKLVEYGELIDEEKLTVYAVYAVDRIPAGSNSCLRITQRYEFHKSGVGCEPSENLLCSRFKPIVEYTYYGHDGETLTKINTVQRTFYVVDGWFDRSTVGLFRDCDAPFNVLSSCAGKIFEQKRNPLPTELFARVIENGQDKGTWDNVHQTFNPIIEEPSLAGALEGKAGCPECVHIHWRWGLFISIIGDPSFGYGRPLIPQGSTQSVDFAVTRRHPGEEDPRDYTELAILNPEPLIQDIVFWYSATGNQPHDTFFSHGGFFSPSTPNVTMESNGVAVTFANLFEEGETTATLIDPASVGQLPPGYIAYNNLAYDITTTATVSGPYTVTFNLPENTAPEVLANLRVFHKERDPNDPTSKVLVDRTLDSTDDGGVFGLRLGHSKNAKVKSLSVNTSSALSVTAVTDSLGQFVIALRPYFSPTTQNFPSGGGAGSIGVKAPDGFGWTATSSDSFVMITSGAGGAGDGTVNYSVAPNDLSAPRDATITIFDRAFTITQEGGDCVVTPISIGQTVEGILTTEDCRSPVRGSRYIADRYSFTTTAGQEISILLQTFDFDTYLYLIGPDGTVIAENDDGGGGTDSRIPGGAGLYQLPASGTYTIEVTSFGEFTTGFYRLNLSGTDCAYLISPVNKSFESTGGSGSIGVTAAAGCDWVAATNDGFITITSGNSGSGNGSVSYDVAPTSLTESRTGTISVAGQTFTVTQQGASPACQIMCPTNIMAGNTSDQCGATVNYSAPTTSGTCGEIACSPSSGSFFPPGTTTVTCTTSSRPGCTFTVTVNDTQPPSIVCPSDLIRSTDTNQCSAIVTYPSPTASDNCSPVTATCNPPSGSVFPKGVTTINCAVTDSSGNSAVCSFTITVEDDQPPALSCPASITVTTIRPGDSSIAVNYPSPAASDNCAGVSVVCSPASGSVFPLGVTTVSCLARDAADNKAGCSFTVTVFDNCLEDDSNRSAVLLFNSQSGDYRFRYAGGMLAGRGGVTRKGNVFTLVDNRADRRVQATVDANARRGSASLQSPPGQVRCSITDRNTTDNSCACDAGG
ncbi:MAG: HYR domain-containing protein [Acidobacteriota bacterium]